MQPELNPTESRLIDSDRNYEVMQDQKQSGLIRWQLDAEDIMLKLKAALLRKNLVIKGDNVEMQDIKLTRTVYVKGKKKGEMVKEEREYALVPLLNEEGLRDLIAIVESYLNKNTYLSELNEFEIAELVRETMISIIGILYSKHREYDLEEKNLDIVINIMFNYIYSAAKRAEKGGERKFITNTTKTIEHKMTKVDEAQQEKKKGFW